MLLYSNGLGAAWFLPDLLLMSCVVLQAVRAATTSQRGLIRTAIVLVVYCLAAARAVSIGTPLLAIVSHAKLLLPVALVAIAPQAVAMIPSKFAKWSLALGAVTIVGVIVNRYVQFPWTGFEIQQFGQTRESSRLWWIAGGYERLAGFASASFTAGGTLVHCYFSSIHRIPSLTLRLGIFALCVYACVLTTNKSSVAAFTVAGLLYVSFSVSVLANAPLLRRLTQIAGALILFLSGMIPMTLATVYASHYAASNSSLMDRAHYTWPGVLDRMVDDGGPLSFLLGSGFGRFGSGAVYSNRFQPPITDVDNFLIYLFATFGIAAIVAYALAAWRAATARPYAIVLLAAFASFAATTNCEGPPVLLTFCLGIALLYAKPEKQGAAS